MTIIGHVLTAALCACCKQARSELLSVAHEETRGRFVAVSLCVRCRHGHWTRRPGVFYLTLPVYQRIASGESCPLSAP